MCFIYPDFLKLFYLYACVRSYGEVCRNRIYLFMVYLMMLLVAQTM